MIKMIKVDFGRFIEIFKEIKGESTTEKADLNVVYVLADASLQEAEETLVVISDIEMELKNHLFPFYRTVQNKKIERKTEEYFIALEHISNLLYKINKFITRIKWLYSSLHDKKIEKLEKDVDTLIFMNTMIINNVKKYFFTEIPASQRNRLLLGLDAPIFFSIEEIKFFLENYIQEPNLQTLEKLLTSIYKFLFNIFLLLSFVYKGKETIEGIFLRFVLSKDIYDEVIRDMLKILEKGNVKEILRNSREYILEFYLERICKFNENKTDNIGKNIYEIFIENCGKAEVLSWVKSNILRKLDEEVYDAFIKLDEDKLLRFKTEIEDFLTKETYYPINFNSYAMSTTIYKKWHEETKKLRSYVRENIRVYIERNTVLEVWEKTKEIFDKKRVVERKKDFKDVKVEELMKEKKGEDLEKDLKLKTLLEKGLNNEKDKKFLKASVSALISNFVEFMSNKQEEHEEIHLIGFYKPGVLLAHIAWLYSFLRLKKDKIYTWAFKVYPHAQTVPLHQHSHSDTYVKNLFVFDESIKTGLTLSFYEQFLARKLNIKQKFPFNVFTIFDFEFYPKLESVKEAEKDGKIRKVFSVKEEEKEEIARLHHVNEEIQKEIYVFLEKDFVEYIDKISENSFEDLIENIVVPKLKDELNVNSEDKINIKQFLISNTLLYFSGIKKLKSLLKNKTIKDEKLYIKPCSQEAEIFIYGLLFTTLMENKRPLFTITLDNEEIQGVKKIFFGITQEDLSGCIIKNNDSIYLLK